MTKKVSLNQKAPENEVSDKTQNIKSKLSEIALT